MSKDLILITELHGAKPVNFIFKTTYFAAPDEGGEKEDKGSYIATCPVCGHEFERIFEKNIHFVLIAEQSYIGTLNI